MQTFVGLQSSNILGTPIATKPDARPLRFSYSTATKNDFSLRVAPLWNALTNNLINNS